MGPRRTRAAETPVTARIRRQTAATLTPEQEPTTDLSAVLDKAETEHREGEASPLEPSLPAQSPGAVSLAEPTLPEISLPRLAVLPRSTPKPGAGYRERIARKGERQAQLSLF